MRFLQSKLASLHYVTSRCGVYDAATGRAVMAFRKLTGMSRVFTASEHVFKALLAGKGQFKVRHPGDGRHVEARLNQQVLALINGSKVERIYHTSSGTPATPTVRGKFRVYLKTPGTNAKGMVDSSYFIRGYAIHGYASRAAVQRQPRLPAGAGPERARRSTTGCGSATWSGSNRRTPQASWASTSSSPPAAWAARIRSAPPPSRRMRSISSSASSPSRSRA